MVKLEKVVRSVTRASRRLLDLVPRFCTILALRMAEKLIENSVSGLFVERKYARDVCRVLFSVLLV
jgi:hypothetical protein